MIRTVKASILIAGLLLSTAAFADAEEGQELFDEAKCMECHNNSDFDESKKVKNFHQLEARVQACQLNTDAGWFDEDTHSVAQYLNKEHYKLKK